MFNAEFKVRRVKEETPTLGARLVVSTKDGHARMMQCEAEVVNHSPNMLVRRPHSNSSPALYSGTESPLFLESRLIWVDLNNHGFTCESNDISWWSYSPLVGNTPVQSNNASPNNLYRSQSTRSLNSTDSLSSELGTPRNPMHFKFATPEPIRTPESPELIGKVIENPSPKCGKQS